MKIKITLLLLVCSIYSNTFSQKKIKGNKVVTKVETTLKAFNKLVINNDFKITLLKSDNSLIEIVTDENIHSAINISSKDSILTVSTSNKIKSSSLNITVFYNNSLKEIVLNNDAQIESLSTLQTNSMLLKINDYSIANLSIKSEKFSLINNNKSRIQLRSKSKLNIDSNQVDLDLNESSKTEMIIKSDNINSKMHGNASINIEGTANYVKAITTESSDFKGEKLNVKNCSTTIKDTASFSILTSEEITIEASEKSKTEIYGNPKITLTRFTGTSKLLKKEL
jgi:hypothetical protein